MQTSPINDAEAAQLLSPLVPFGHLLIAVSGGPDSMALLGLAAVWAKSAGVTLACATFDHGLRAASANEAALAGQAASHWGVPHTVPPLVGG